MPIQKNITSNRVPIKIWTNDIGQSALEQAMNLANHMPVYSHLALMPDVHLGKGMPIGGVLCSHGAGCRMSRTKALKTLDIDKCVAHMRSMGLRCDSHRFSLDEAKEAYKNIQQVIAEQEDLVKVITELRPYKFPAIKG